MRWEIKRGQVAVIAWIALAKLSKTPFLNGHRFP